MSTPPLEGTPTPTTASPGGYGFAPATSGPARLPVPGNAELIVFLLVWLVLAILWAASDEVDAGLFATLTVVLTFGYLLSRGIAKASRVLEH